MYHFLQILLSDLNLRIRMAVVSTYIYRIEPGLLREFGTKPANILAEGKIYTNIKHVIVCYSWVGLFFYTRLFWLAQLNKYVLIFC